MAKVTADKLERFRTQTRNSNRHTQRGMGQLEASMRKYGYVTPMTAAADGEIIDGSARAETGATVFGDDVLVVHHDGTKPVIMVRDDIPSADTPEAREISIAANRIAQVNLDFDAEQILADLNGGANLSAFWFDNELSDLIAADEQTDLNNVGADALAGLTQDDGKQIKPVLFVRDIADFERAIMATGVKRRGEALMTICRYYLEHSEEGQQYIGFESLFAA